MNHVESIRHQYSTNADSYRTSNYHSSAPDLEVLREVAQLQGTERVLDIGTGTGHTALAVAQGANHVVGIDLTPQMLEQARQLASSSRSGSWATTRARTSSRGPELQNQLKFK